ncbi:UNVERIFIED_CONTAM: hypothetical protein Cloal_3572 [Acetivibrio alkalicellulosi]
MHSFCEKDFLNFSKSLSDEVFKAYTDYYKKKVLNNNFSIEYTNSVYDIKSEHKIDTFIVDCILSFIKQNYSYIYDNANIHMEDYQFSNNKDFINLYIDPVDGSRSADLNIGDPCFMIAYSEKTKDVKFNDLKSCFIKGLKSNDTYFTYKNKGYYVPNGFSYKLEEDTVTLLTNKYSSILKPVKNNYKNITLSNCSVILRDGYGMRSIVEQKIDHSVLNKVYHCFSHDITGIELCYTGSCRGIAHIMVEARRHRKGNKMMVSDGFNLIPYPFVKSANCIITSLDGTPLDDVSYNPKDIYDFIACINNELLNEFLEYVKK